MSISDELDRIHEDSYNHTHDYFYPDDIPDDVIFPDEVISEKIDYTVVNKRIEESRTQSLDFLKSAVGGSI